MGSSDIYITVVDRYIPLYRGVFCAVVFDKCLSIKVKEHFIIRVVTSEVVSLR